MADYEKCSEGEDLTFLAYCAVTGDFSRLTDGLILPKYMSNEGEVVADWILARRFEGDAEWPPSYEALTLMFQDFDWPDIGGIHGLDPEVPAYDVLRSYSIYSLAVLTRVIQKVMRMQLDDEDWSPLLAKMEGRMTELRTILEPTKQTLVLGEDPDMLRNAIVGSGVQRSLAKVRTPFEWLDKQCRPFIPGIYAFFARPKNGKSWVIQLIAVYLAMELQMKVLLVDPELNGAELVQRLASLVMGVPYKEVSTISLHIADEIPLTPAQEEIMSQLDEVQNKLRNNPYLVILGKDKIDSNIGGFDVDGVVRTADENGCSIICAEQVHKYKDPSLTTRNTSDAMKAHAAITKMSNVEDKLWFVTTQQNREFSPKKGQLPKPTDEGVFGSDALSQNARFLCHVWKLELEDNDCPDDPPLLWMLTPTISRGRTSLAPGFVIFRPGDVFEELEPQYGRAFAEARLMELDALEEKAKKRAKTLLKEQGLSNHGDRETGSILEDKKEALLEDESSGKGARKRVNSAFRTVGRLTHERQLSEHHYDTEGD